MSHSISHSGGLTDSPYTSFQITQTILSSDSYFLFYVPNTRITLLCSPTVLKLLIMLYFLLCVMMLHAVTIPIFADFTVDLLANEVQNMFFHYLINIFVFTDCFSVHQILESCVFSCLLINEVLGLPCLIYSILLCWILLHVSNRENYFVDTAKGTLAINYIFLAYYDIK